MPYIKRLINLTMNTNKVMALAVMCMLLGLAGCVSPAEQLDDSVVDQVKIGMDQKEVVKLLGQPKKTESGADKISLDEYWFGFNRPVFSHSASMGEFTIRSMEITYDANKKVMDKYSHVGKVPYHFLGNHNMVTGKPGAEQHLSEIQKGKDHLYGLQDSLGEPNVISRHLDGILHYHWFFLEFSSQGLKRGKELEVIFDPMGYVADFRIHEDK